MALLTFFAVWSAVLAVAEKNADIAVWLAVIPVFWTFWAGVFYWHSRERADLLTRGISWLLKGSVLELLVVVPCHVYVRRRGDCSAPAITGFGIATGIAVMLLSFGPSVLFLYKRRLERYSTAAPPPAQR